MKSIGIIGCGWLGKPLAHTLRQAYKVECFSRKDEDDSDINYVFNPSEQSPFWQNDVLIIAVSTKDNYLETLKDIAKKADPASLIMLMSSTSVYREFDSDVDETVKITSRTLQKEAEELISSLHERSLILRLGGLMGKDRIAGKWKSASSFTDGPVNYIHLDDVINIISAMLKNNIHEGVFNLVAPQHPLRSEIHTHNAQRFGFKLGSFQGHTGRIVHAKAIDKTIQYAFIHPDPLEFWT